MKDMQCKLYENIYCIQSDAAINEPSGYCCHDCFIHVAIEHDKQIDKNDKTII